MFQTQHQIQLQIKYSGKTRLTLIMNGLDSVSVSDANATHQHVLHLLYLS